MTGFYDPKYLDLSGLKVRQVDTEAAPYTSTTHQSSLASSSEQREGEGDDVTITTAVEKAHISTGDKQGKTPLEDSPSKASDSTRSQSRSPFSFFSTATPSRLAHSATSSRSPLVDNDNTAVDSLPHSSTAPMSPEDRRQVRLTEAAVGDLDCVHTARHSLTRPKSGSYKRSIAGSYDANSEQNDYSVTLQSEPGAQQRRPSSSTNSDSKQSSKDDDSHRRKATLHISTFFNQIFHLKEAASRTHTPRHRSQSSDHLSSYVTPGQPTDPSGTEAPYPTIDPSLKLPPTAIQTDYELLYDSSASHVDSESKDRVKAVSSRDVLMTRQVLYELNHSPAHTAPVDGMCHMHTQTDISIPPFDNTLIVHHPSNNKQTSNTFLSQLNRLFESIYDALALILGTSPVLTASGLAITGLVYYEHNLLALALLVPTLLYAVYLTLSE